MYKPNPNEVFDYIQYLEYIKDIMNKMNEEINKEKIAVKEALERCNFADKEDVHMASFFGTLLPQSESGIDVDNFILAVGISYHIYMKRKEYNKLNDELVYLQTEKGKKEYETKTGKYSNMVLL